MCKAAGVLYRGEGTAAVAQNIFLHSLNQPRKDFTAAEKMQVRERQKHLCTVCKDELGEFPKRDHVKSLAKWGSDDVDNVEFKCPTCHLDKTERERRAGNSKFNPLASVMSRDPSEQFLMAPKPRQLMVGKVKEGDLGLDVVGCRMYGLGNNGSPLPRFNLLDKPESYDASKKYHFYYVDAGVVTTAEELYDRLPYTGPGWYWRAAWDMPGFLKIQDHAWATCVRGMSSRTASRRLRIDN